MKPTDVAGGVTDEELLALAQVVQKLMNHGHERGAMGALTRFSREQQARGVERALKLVEQQVDHLLGSSETAAELRALAERIREGQL